MKSQKNLALAVLTFAILGVAILAWRQHLELIALRTAAMNNSERAGLQKRIWDAETKARELSTKLAALSSRDTGDATAGDTGQPGQNQRGRRGGPGGGPPRGGMDGMMAFLDQPEMQKLMMLQQKGQLDGRYAALFKNLNLSPEQLDKFKTLLVEKQNAMQDVFIAARAQGINPLRDDPDGFRKMVADTQAEVDNSIKATLGDDAFAKYQGYQETQAQRSVVNQLQQSLSYTNAPLSDSQAEALVQILAQTAPKNTNTGGNRPAGMGDANVTVAVGPPGGGGGGMFFNVVGGAGGFVPGGGASAPITDEAIAAAQSVLSAPQVQGLQQLQQQQQTQQQLQQSIRQSMDGQQRGGGNSAPRRAPASGG